MLTGLSKALRGIGVPLFGGLVRNNQFGTSSSSSSGPNQKGLGFRGL